MKRIALFITMLFVTSSAIAGQVYRHELMFVNCTLQPIVVSNGDKLPYRFSLDPLVDATDGTSPSYTFTIPNQIIYKHPISVYLGWFGAAADMHLFLTGAMTTEMNVSIQEAKYFTYKSDPRYISILGYNTGNDPSIGNRTIIGLGCDLPSSNNVNGGKSKLPQMMIFKQKIN